MNDRKGLTLIELILTLAIVSLVIPLLYSIFFVGSTSHSVSTNKGFAQQDIRIATDFIKKELRLVTNIGDVALESNEYYSLRINAEGNIIKSKYIRQVDDTVMETIMTTINGNLGTLTISNNEAGIIDIELEQIEQSGSRDAGFALKMAVSTENSPNLLSNLNLNLIEGDILYYQNSKLNSLSNSIYLNKPDEIGGESVMVRFYRNDGTTVIHQEVIGIGETMESLPPTPLRGGYTFTEWNTDMDGLGISYGAGGKTTFEVPSNNTDLYAIWTASGELAQVGIDTSSGTDGVIDIDGNVNPIKNDGRFVVDRKSGSTVKIKLAGYTSAHISKVTVTVNNSTTAIEEGGFVIFRAEYDSNGNKKDIAFDVTITIKTDGQSTEYSKTYRFITSS